MDGKLKDKLDKADFNEIESKENVLKCIERLIGAVDLQIIEKTKKNVDKSEIQRLKKTFDL